MIYIIPLRLPLCLILSMAMRLTCMIMSRHRRQKLIWWMFCVYTEHYVVQCEHGQKLMRGLTWEITTLPATESLTECTSAQIQDAGAGASLFKVKAIIYSLFSETSQFSNKFVHCWRVIKAGENWAPLLAPYFQLLSMTHTDCHYDIFSRVNRFKFTQSQHIQIHCHQSTYECIPVSKTWVLHSSQQEVCRPEQTAFKMTWTGSGVKTACTYNDGIRCRLRECVQLCTSHTSSASRDSVPKQSTNCDNTSLTCPCCLLFDSAL